MSIRKLKEPLKLTSHYFSLQILQNANCNYVVSFQVKPLNNSNCAGFHNDVFKRLYENLYRTIYFSNDWYKMSGRKRELVVITCGWLFFSLISRLVLY